MVEYFLDSREYIVSSLLNPLNSILKVSSLSSSQDSSWRSGDDFSEGDVLGFVTLNGLFDLLRDSSSGGDEG